MTARGSVSAASATKHKAVASTCTTTVTIGIAPPAGSGGEVAVEPQCRHRCCTTKATTEVPAAASCL